jgi:chaperonin cofactor prefoldin
LAALRETSSTERDELSRLVESKNVELATLERDVRTSNERVERLTTQLADAEAEKSQLVSMHKTHLFRH